MRMANWYDAIIFNLKRQFRWSFIPPLMVYFAAGVSGLTAIVGTFFVKEYLGLPASFLASLAFWAGMPWALKMPIGHLVDVIWRWKAILVYVGAGLIASSILIMYGLISSPQYMSTYITIESWFVLSVMLAPGGYVLQDAVADAMSVEAVPRVDPDGQPLSQATLKSLHTTMQTLGRMALISGLIAVALLNIFMFAGVENMSQSEKAAAYADIYLIALVIPVVSISGVLLAAALKRKRRNAMAVEGIEAEECAALLDQPREPTKPNYWYFGGGIVFVALALTFGLSDIALAREIVFLGSMAVVLFLMRRLSRELSKENARAMFGTAIIIFVFRAVPSPGPGAIWFEIDVLGFDQQFLSILTLITSMLTLVGMILLRPLMASKSISYIVVLLTFAAGLLSLPNIGLYYGIHHWTASLTAGIVDARFIALIDTMIESPLGQIAMIPMLAWIAKNAPENLKATFFAVMASFTNLALSASNLLTKYLNEIFVVTREVRNREIGVIEIPADYSELGWLLIASTLILVLAPLLTIVIVQHTSFHTSE